MKATLNLENDYGFVLDMDISDKDNPSVTVYDFEGNEISGGGGGGGVTGPFCVLTIHNTETDNYSYSVTSSEVYDDDFMYYHTEDGYFDYSGLTSETFAPDEARAFYTVPLPLMVDPLDPSTIVSAINVIIYDADSTLTDLVNCTVITGNDGNGDYKALQITDPTQPASATWNVAMIPQ